MPAANARAANYSRVRLCRARRDCGGQADTKRLTAREDAGDQPAHGAGGQRRGPATAAGARGSTQANAGLRAPGAPCSRIARRPKYMGVRKNTGFTLIELLVVLAIIGIVSAIALPGLLRARQAADEASALGAV